MTWRLITLVFLLSCSSYTMELSNFYLDINKINNSGFEEKSAEEKCGFIWSLIERSQYKKFPEITAPNFWGFCDIMSADFLSQAFSHQGDCMIDGRAKHIHSFGTSIRVSFIKNPASKLYTGIFKEGSKYGIIRLSLASPAEANKCIPGIALKFFQDGKASINTMAMYSLDGQDSPNLFEHDFTNILPTPACSFKSSLLQWRFSAAISLLGQEHGDIKTLSCTELAHDDHETIAPYKLIYKPSLGAQQLFEGISFNDDFRAKLENNGQGIILYKIYALMDKNSTEEDYLGYIKTRSAFISSSFGDQNLYFKHPPVIEKQ